MTKVRLLIEKLRRVFTKRASLVLLFALVVVVGLILLKNVTGGPNFVIHSGERYSIAYPSGWTRVENIIIGETRFSLGKASPLTSIQVNVIEAYKDNKSVGAYSNEFLDNSKEKLTNFALLQVESGKLLEVESAKITYIYDGASDVGALKATQVDMLSGNTVYRVNYTSSQADFDKYYSLFEKTLSYLRVY